jgi:hypothetical protein
VISLLVIPFVKVPGLVSPPVRAVEKSLATIAGHCLRTVVVDMYVGHFAALKDNIAMTKTANPGHEIAHSPQRPIHVGSHRTAFGMCWVRPVRPHAPHSVMRALSMLRYRQIFLAFQRLTLRLRDGAKTWHAFRNKTIERR